MLKNKSKIIILFISILVIACSKNSNPKLEEVNSIIKSGNLNHEFYLETAILIIPNAGCEGCITNSENFVMTNIDRTNQLDIIFTAVSSIKGLKLKLGRDLVERENVFVDTDNIFYSSTLASIYPSIVYLKDKKAVQIEEVSPYNEQALDTLAIRLKDLR
ncbi:hypothetical protein [Roseivirga spongicola]|uniref:Uncharacterized protein n=1 Tax=Roseivirga spongicola TaxID=333140 RepID=A0A150XA85_9BACT|nr:hypothetical protein [Roseivirga spongicola]KYG75584.1 hypothetical protein AWW68_07030 [Roseivirga spongicola]WPZ10859.1 hypothetical protein T7867_01945 [Roseivirga spongicola]